MPIIFHKDTLTFHLYNDNLSCVIAILPNEQVGGIYLGARLNDKANFGYLVNRGCNGMIAVTSEDDGALSLHHVMQEYPALGTSDFHYPAYRVVQENGSGISDYRYAGFDIYAGKKKLSGLPATYVESDSEADTLEIHLRDALTGGELTLCYTIWKDMSAIARSVRFENRGKESLTLDALMSANVDFRDGEFDMITLNGAWARERHVKTWRLHEGVQGIYSLRGTSSCQYNPFFALKRPNADENSGEVYGFSLVYSGNHRELVELDTYGMTRCQIGIEPDGFGWRVEPGESFQSPEAVIVYSNEGLGGMSRTYHRLYRTRLAGGYWRDRERPILVNNWEATGMIFTEDQLVGMAREAKELGAELFVLDDGWFGERDNDRAGLGDWHIVSKKKLPEGLEGLSKKIRDMGLDFGLWIEPEMVNPDSDLYRTHPEWVISTPGRHKTTSRNQLVLDMSRREVVDYLYDVLSDLLGRAEVSYVKWDMNRCITEYYSTDRNPASQGENYHAYILGVYDLYQRLTSRFPQILFESCASGGARFDPGMLFYAPQTWTSDCTDAIERLDIQYGTSLVYPLSGMGAHVSEVPNQQNGRITPFDTRYNVACFGVLGYELDPMALTDEEKELVKEQIAQYKEIRSLVHKGLFYRLISPVNGDRAAWMVVSEDKTQALVGFYRIAPATNPGWEYLKLCGLDGSKLYEIPGYAARCYGDELMNIGLLLHPGLENVPQKDYASLLLHIRAV